MCRRPRPCLGVPARAVAAREGVLESLPGNEFYDRSKRREANADDTTAVFHDSP